MMEHRGWRSLNALYVNDLQDFDRERRGRAWFTYETWGAFHRFISETSFGVLIGRVQGPEKPESTFWALLSRKVFLTDSVAFHLTPERRSTDAKIGGGFHPVSLILLKGGANHIGFTLLQGSHQVWR